MTLTKSVLGSVAAASLTVIAAFASVPAQTNSCSYSFSTNLRLGSVSSDVMNLQKVLNMSAVTQVSSYGAGSPNAETLRFGPATKRAVIAFQKANNITPNSGAVGPLTRGVLNTICKGTTNTGTTTTPVSTNTGTGVISNNIPVSVLVAGQSNAKLGEFVVSGNGMVTNLTFMRTGLSNNATLANVYLYDGATRITDGSSVRTDGTVSFNSLGGLFTVSGSKTITVRANILTGTSGQTIGVALTGVTMAGGTTTPVTGVQGPLFSISSANMVTANLTTTSPSPSISTINSGSMNQTLWSNSVSIGTNPAKLQGLTLKMIGSAPANTLANVQLYVDGVSQGTASINAMNQYMFNLMSNPKMLTTGAHLVEVRGDVVAGAYRNFYMSLENASDLMIEDSNLPGVFVTPTYLSGALTIVSGGQVTINQGTLTITQDPAFNNTTTLVGGASQVTLASYKFTAYGEDVKVTSLNFQGTLTGATPASSTLANVGLYVGGGQVGSNQTITWTTGTVAFTGLGTNLYVPAGTSVIVQVKGDTSNTSGAAYTAGSLAINLAANTSNVQGITSSQVSNSNTSTIGGQSLTIGNNVTWGVTSGFGASTKAPNAQGVKIGSFSISAGSAEGLTVNQVTVALTGTMLGVNQISNLTVKDGSTVMGTPIGNPTASNSFSTNVTVAQGTTKTFDVYADFGSGASTYTAITAMTSTYRGNTSNISATTASAGGVIATTANVATIAVGGITFNNGLSLSSQAIVGPNANFAIGTFNFKVSNNVGGAVIKDVTVTVPANTATSVTMNGKTASVVAGTAIIYNVGVTVPADSTGVNVPMTVSLVCTGTANGCSANSPVIVQATTTLVTYYDGSATQSVVPTAATAYTNGHAIYASKPSFAVDSTQKTGLVLNAENKIGEVTISADAGGTIKVNNIAFNLAVSGITLTNFSGARIADGNTTISGSAISNGGCTAVGVCAFSLGATPNGYTIAAGTSKTFSVYASVNGTAGASVVNSVSASVVPGTAVAATTGTVSWDDSMGGATAQSASTIYNFPTASYSLRQ